MRKEKLQSEYHRGWLAGHDKAYQDVDYCYKNVWHKSALDLQESLQKLPDNFFYMGHEYVKLPKPIKSDPWEGCCVGGGCGPTYTVDSKGVVEASAIEGTYTVVVTKN